MNLKNKGLTLIEVLVVLAIMGSLTTSLYVVFKSGVDAWSKSNARLEILQNARAVMDQISRELPGAMAGSLAADPKFSGADGVGDNGSDSVEFVTEFAGAIYKLKYELVAGNILERRYIKDPPDYTNTDYADTQGEPDGIEEAIIEFGYKISDIQFTYWDDNVSAWTPNGDWTATGSLPGAVRVELKLKEKPDDDDARDHSFKTEVCIPK